MKYFCIVFLLFFSLIRIYSQEKSKDSLATLAHKETSRWELLKYDGASTFGGIKHVYSQPFKWKGKDWAKFGGIMGGTALIYLIDEPANEFFIKQGRDIPDFIRDAGFRFGKPLINYGFTTGIYAFGLITKNEKVRKTGVLLIASATAGGIIQSISKTVVGRARPTTGKGNRSFIPFSNEAGYHSFPSGHAVLSVTTAYAISKQFKNLYVKGGIYALGMITPISRLWSGAHWLTDVTLGTVLSIVIVDSIDNYLNKKERYTYNKHKLNIKWDFQLGLGQFGLVGRF